MSDSPETSRPLTRDQLVAYLDGELDDHQRQEVESRLAGDATLRDQLSMLERTWQELDQLPRYESDDALTQTTVEMIVQQEVGPRKRKFTAARGTLLLAGVLAGVVTPVAFGWSFALRPDWAHYPTLWLLAFGCLLLAAALPALRLWRTPPGAMLREAAP